MKRIISLIMMLMLVLSMVGCGSKEKASEKETSKDTEVSDSNKKQPDNKQNAKELKPLTISIGHWDAGEMLSGGENDPILKLLEKKFNVTFEARSVSWSDYSEKYKLWAASGELPDLFATDVINSQTYETWVNQGIIRELPKDISAYPNIEKIMQMPDVKPLEREGVFYMIPRLTYPQNDMWALDRGLIIRKDWLEKLGLGVPKSYEELKSTLKTIVNSDLDGNGVKDTIGLTQRTNSHLAAFFLGSVPQVTNGGWLKEDGQWVPAYISKNMITGIKQLRDLYKEGLLDNDFAIMKTDDGTEKFAQGNVAMLAHQVLPTHLYNIRSKWDKYNNGIDFEDAIAIVPFFAHEDGNTYSFATTTYWSESYFSGDISDEKMERILMLYDYLASEEFSEVKTYGIEDVDFKKDSDQYTILLEKGDDGRYENLTEKYPSLKVFDTLVAWGQEKMLIKNQVNYTKYGQQLVDMSADFYEFSRKNMVPTPTNFDVFLMVTPTKTKLSAIRYFDDVTKVIISDEDPETEWKKIIEGYDAQGVPQAIKEVNEKAKELGIE